MRNECDETQAPAAVREENGKRLGKRSHDVINTRITLKQWRIFQAVYDKGSFAGAGTLLHLSQSTISYTLARMQEQLGVTLFQLEGRRATVTPAGKALLSRSRHLLREAAALESFAARLAGQQDNNVLLLVENTFPISLLTKAIHAFSKTTPSITLIPETIALQRIRSALAASADNLAISSYIPEGYLGVHFANIDYVPVVHVTHPFAGHAVPSVDDLRNELQIVVGDPDAMVMSATTDDTLTVKSGRIVVDSIEAAIQGLQDLGGYAWLPRHVIEGGAAPCDLCILRPKTGGLHKKQFHFVQGAHLAHDALLLRLSNALRSGLTYLN